jgi:hypothetical protein
MVKNQQQRSRGSVVAEEKEFVWESSGRFIEAVKRAAERGERQQIY